MRISKTVHFSPELEQIVYFLETAHLKSVSVTPKYTLV